WSWPRASRSAWSARVAATSRRSTDRARSADPGRRRVRERLAARRGRDGRGAGPRCRRHPALGGHDHRRRRDRRLRPSRPPLRLRLDRPGRPGAAIPTPAAALAASGRRVLLYNFVYTDRGGGRPDPPDVLEATTRAVGDFARTELGARRRGPGGPSMGARIASQAFAKGAPCDGLVFLASPLPPPGRHEKMRDR